MDCIGKLAMGVGVILMLYLAITTIGAALLLNHLLTPGRVDWSGAKRPAPADPLELNYRGMPGEALGLDYRDVSYATPLGATPAWLVPAMRSGDLWAIYVHGIGGIRENGYKQLSILHAANLPVLMICYRNDTGAPAGDRPLYAFGLDEWQDLDAAVTHALQNGARRIVLVADSMGGAIVGQFLRHSSQTGSVAALALDAPALSFRAAAHHLAAMSRLPLHALVTDMALNLLGVLKGVRFAGLEVLDQVVSYPGPVFVAHGSADRLVPVALSDRLVEARRAPSFYVRGTAEHLRTFQQDAEAYREGMLGMLEAARHGTPPP